MDTPTTRSSRLQALRDRWFTEKVSAQLNPLLDEPTFAQPANCNELMIHPRLTAAFSSLGDDPAVVGITQDQADERDRVDNAARFGVENPAAVLASLGGQFDLAAGGSVDDPNHFKKAYVVLDRLKSINQALASADESHANDARAIEQAQQVIRDLTSELGISLPITQGRQPSR